MILCGVYHESDDFETLFQNYKYIVETPDIEVLAVYNDFEINLFYSKTFCENLLVGLRTTQVLVKGILLRKWEMIVKTFLKVYENYFCHRM